MWGVGGGDGDGVSTLHINCIVAGRVVDSEGALFEFSITARQLCLKF